ncbi:MAG: peptidylprolyl isomerase [Bacilli bacterium]|nr:peptidylprolyl isomerase [Bacilli bacterium]
MKKKLLLISLCSILLLCSGCKKEVKLKDGKEVVASIEGKDFTAEELFDELKETYGASTLTNMIDDYIVDKEVKDSDEANEYAKAQIESMKQQYESAGYDWNNVLSQYGYSSEKDLVKDYSKDYKKQIVAKNYLKKEVTEDEINRYYEEEIYGNYTVKHILIKPETKDDMSDTEIEEAENKAKEKAEEVIKKLDDGSKWADLVKDYSEDEGSKSNEGLIENFTKGDVVDEFFEATLELKDGEYTKEPVESTYGYHIILKVSNTEKPSVKDSKEKILKEIVENKLSNDENLYNNTWTKIRESYKLNINDSTIKSAYNKNNN